MIALLVLGALLILGGYIVGLIATFGGGEPAGGFALLGVGALAGLVFWFFASQDAPKNGRNRIPVAASKRDDPLEMPDV